MMSNSRSLETSIPSESSSTVDTSTSTPRLLGPDYFRTKLVPTTSPDNTSITANKQPLQSNNTEEQDRERSMATAMVMGPRVASSGRSLMTGLRGESTSWETGGRELHQRQHRQGIAAASSSSRPQYLQLVGTKHSSNTSPPTSSGRTRATPAAEAAMKRERLNRIRKRSPAASCRLDHHTARDTQLSTADGEGEVVKSKPGAAQPHDLITLQPVVPHCSTFRALDEGAGWTGWSLNDLDIDSYQQPTTKPFVESGMMTSPISTLTTTTPIIENFDFQGQPTRCSHILENLDFQGRSRYSPTVENFGIHEGRPTRCVSPREDLTSEPPHNVVQRETQTAEELSQSHDQDDQYEGSEKVAEETLCVAVAGVVPAVSNDEIMADLLQKDEYSRELPEEEEVRPTSEDYSYEMARRYQEEQDARTAQELQEMEDGQRDSAQAKKSYLYKAPPREEKQPHSPSFSGGAGIALGQARDHDDYHYQQHHQCHDHHHHNTSPADNVATPHGHDDDSGTINPPTDSIDMSYEALLNLEDVSRGIGEETLAQCTNTQSYKEREGASSESKSCAVCLTGFRAGQLLRYLPCLHSFHCHCIDQWLERHSNCPVCMKNIQDLHLTVSS